MITKLLISPSAETYGKVIERILGEHNLKKDHPDVLWIEEEKLGVEQAKKIRGFLSIKPYSAKGRVVVVLHADNFTLDAQNSLLKTLEEPPTNAIIILAAGSDKSFLPTVLSRVEIVYLRHTTSDIRLQSNANGLKTENIKELFQASLEERFEFIEKLEDKEQFFQQLLTFFHTQLPKNPAYLPFTKELLKAEAWKEANGNLRAILEYLMLNLPHRVWDK